MDRRSALKLLSVSAAGGALASTMPGLGRASEGGVSLKLAGYPYDRVRALVSGSQEIAGVSDYVFEQDKIGNLNTDALGGPMSREVTEIGMIPYILSYANGGLDNHVLLPIFLLRVFRHKSVFIRPDRGIERPEDLKGKTIASPGFSSTSLTWIRGFMQDQYGVSPSDVKWVISRKDSAGKDTGGASEYENLLPDGLDISFGPEGLDESDLLIEGHVDALFHAAEPRAFVEGHPMCVRLFSDSRAVEQEYYRETGIFPIMHAVAMRKDVIAAHPDLPRAVFDAYVSSKQALYDWQRGLGWVLNSQPWFSQDMEDARAVMGDNFYSYGFSEANLKTMRTLLAYAHEQGLAERAVTVEDLFLPESLSWGAA